MENIVNLSYTNQQKNINMYENSREQQTKRKRKKISNYKKVNNQTRQKLIEMVTNKKS